MSLPRSRSRLVERVPRVVPGSADAFGIWIGDADLGQNFAFEPLHRLRLAILDVIVPQQVEKAMHCKMRDMIADRLAKLASFADDGLASHRNVTKRYRRIPQERLGARERQHIGRPVAAAPASIQAGDRGIIAQQNR